MAMSILELKAAREFWQEQLMMEMSTKLTKNVENYKNDPRVSSISNMVTILTQALMKRIDDEMHNDPLFVMGEDEIKPEEKDGSNLPSIG